MRSGRCPTPIRTLAILAVGALAGCRSPRENQQAAAAPIPPREIGLVRQLASRLPASEAVTLLTDYLEEHPPSQHGPLLDLLGDRLRHDPWMKTEASWATGFAIDHLWADETSLWAAVSSDRQSSAFRWDFAGQKIAAILFPVDGPPIRSWQFSPDGNHVLIDRAGHRILCDAQCMRPIRELPVLTTTIPAESTVCFTPDSLLFAHAGSSGTTQSWQIRDSASGEVLRSEEIPTHSAPWLAGALAATGLDLLQADGSVRHIPLDPTRPATVESTGFDGQVWTAIPSPAGGFLALVRRPGERQNRFVRLARGREASDAPHGWNTGTNRLPWTRCHPSIWHSPYQPPSPAIPVPAPGITASCENSTHIVLATDDGTISLCRKLPTAAKTGQPAHILPQDAIPVILRHLEALGLGDWRPSLASPTTQPTADAMTRLAERLRLAREQAPPPAIVDAFANGDGTAITDLIKASASSPTEAASCLAEALKSPRPEWISLCLATYPDLPDELVRIAKTRIAWLTDRPAEAIALWPDGFPDYESLRACHDWNGWESADFRIPFELVRQAVQEILAGFHVPAHSTPDQRDAVFAKLLDPTSLRTLGKHKTIEACLLALQEFASHPEEGARTLALAHYAKTLGAPTAPCLRAEALALTSLGEHAKARTRWVDLITYHPLAQHQPKDYTEAAYSAYENHDAAQAMAFLATGTHRFPADSGYALRAGWIALLIGQPEAAWRFLLRGQQAGFPEDKTGHALALLAIASLQSGAPEESTAYFGELSRLDPSWCEPARIESLGWPEELQQALLHLAETSPFTPDHSPAPGPTSRETTR